MRESFWRRICQVRELWLGMFIFAVLLLSLLAFVAPALTPDMESYPIAVVSAVMLIGIAGGSGVMVWTCRKRRLR